MSACPQSPEAAGPAAPPAALLQTMGLPDLAEVLAIEQSVYELPWTQGNFIDSLAAGYLAWVLRAPGRAPDGGPAPVLAYCLAMQGFGELHLLNIAVAPGQQGRGLARQLLAELCRYCRSQGSAQLWLEVRVSNHRAREVYVRYGFSEVGLRPGYYPVRQGPREDAVLMSLDVTSEGAP